MNFLPLLTSDSAGGAGLIYTVVIYGALFAFMWFVLIRPQRKRQKEQDSLQKSISVGDDVLLNGGMYGKVVDTVNDLLIVELGLNKSVRVPVQRAGIISKAAPDLSTVKEKESDAE